MDLTATQWLLAQTPALQKIREEALERELAFLSYKRLRNENMTPESLRSFFGNRAHEFELEYKGLYCHACGADTPDGEGTCHSCKCEYDGGGN